MDNVFFVSRLWVRIQGVVHNGYYSFIFVFSFCTPRTLFYKQIVIALEIWGDSGLPSLSPNLKLFLTAESKSSPYLVMQFVKRRLFRGLKSYKGIMFNWAIPTPPVEGCIETVILPHPTKSSTDQDLTGSHG